MRINSRHTFLITTLVFILFCTNQAVAVSKIGSVCSKLSSFQQSGKTLLVCDVAKKKKVWRKATRVELKLYVDEQLRIQKEAMQQELDEAQEELDRIKKERESELAARVAEKAAADKVIADAVAKAAADKVIADAVAKAAADKVIADAVAKAAADKVIADAGAKAAAAKAAIPTVTLLSIFGRPYQNTGNTWYIPITNSSTEAIPGYSVVQIKYGTIDWTDIGAGRNCGTYGCGAIVTGFVDVCPQFRLIARSNDIVKTIWQKSASSGGTC